MSISRGANVFLYGLVLIGVIFALASLYTTVWAAPVNQSTLPTPAPTSTPLPTPIGGLAPLDADPPVAAAEGGSIKAYASGIDSSVTSASGNVTIDIPGSAPTGTGYIVYAPAEGNEIPVAPKGYNITSSVFNINLLNVNGDANTNTKFLSPVTITLTYSDDDVAVAEGNPSRLVIHKYDDNASVWVALNTTVDLANKTVQTKVSRFSLFALMGGAKPPTPTPTPDPTTVAAGSVTAEPIAEPTAEPTAEPIAEPTATALPPAPGDFAPSNGLLVLMVLLSFTLIAAGGYFLKQNKEA